MTEPPITPIYFDLPHPPSVNGIWRGGKAGRFYKSKHYKAWENEAGWAVREQAKGKRVSGPFAVQIDLKRPDNRRRDLDNTIKVLLDLLKNLHVTDDDSECQYIEAKWVERGKGVRLAVRPCTRWGMQPWTSSFQTPKSSEAAP
jgi:crossover junction endodeoxyribonuclease RusA